MSGSPIRQEYLEMVVRWINRGDIEGYMATHQHDLNANESWLYFQSVMAWVKATFPNTRREMKGVSWGELFNEFGESKVDPTNLEDEIARLMVDEDVTNKKGIYAYLLDRQERHLNIRAFTPNQKREAYERQEGICCICGDHFEIGVMEADHITPWHEGGKTDSANCQMLCREDNRRKGGK
jgi:hypothetical protein